MTITVEGTPTENSGDSTTFTVAVPTVGGGILAGDYIVVAAMHCESEDNTWGVPPGMDGEWLAELQVGQTPPSIPGTQVFYELCEGGESGSRSSVGTFVGSWNVLAWVLRGADTVTPLDVTVTTVQSASNGDPNPPSITPANDDCAIIAVGFKDQANTTPQTVTTWPTGYTDLQIESNTNTTTGGILAVAMDILVGGAASPENPSAYVMSEGADQWAAATLAIRPAVAAVSYEQEGHQFRLDDGSEVAATDLGAQDSDISSVKEVNRRLRILADATGDAPSQDFQIKYRKVADPDSEWRAVPLCAPPPSADPPELADLLAWYDATDAPTVFADDPPTIQAVNNDPIRYVVNKGIDGANSDLDFLSIGGANDIVLHTGTINGLQTMAALDVADTGSAALAANGTMPATPNGVTCAIVCQKRDLTVGVFGMNPASLNNFAILGIGSKWSLEAASSGEKFEVLADVIEDEWIWAYITNDSAGNAFWRVSGISEQSDTGNPFDDTGQRIVVQSRHGRVPEVLYWRIALDTAAKADLVSYFNGKYGTLPVIGS